MFLTVTSILSAVSDAISIQSTPFPDPKDDKTCPDVPELPLISIRSPSSSMLVKNFCSGIFY